MKKNTSLPCMIGHIKWPSTLTPSDSYADCKCGGVIIRTNFVLTAGHCVDEDESYVVRAGTKYCTWYGDMYDVNNKILHPHYALEPLKNDIAILETEKRIIFSEDVQLIVMAEENFNPSDLYVQISGYGRTSFEGPNSPQLMKIEDTALSDDECSEYRPTIPDGAFCHIDRKHRWTSRILKISCRQSL